MSNNELKRTRNKIWRFLLLQIVVFTISYWFLYVLTFYVFQWRVSGFLYGLLGDSLYYSLLDIAPAIIIIVYIAVIGYLIYRAINKPFRFMGQLIDALDVVFHKDEAMIALSPEFKELETKLNTLKYTSLKNEQIAKEAEQRKNDLVVYLAHDIKTPLTSVIGYLSLLEEAPDMPIEQRARYLDITLKKAYRLESLLDEFFEITRFNLQSIVLEQENLDLSYMLAQLVDEFYPQLTAAKRQATVQVDEGLQVYADGQKLARVFNNVLKNAIAYGYEDTVIEITAYTTGDEIVIDFKNRGRTIPPQRLAMIFEKFYRLDTARSGQTGGAGLGLAIAKEIVEAHGGVITVESAEEVTVFTVRLPAK